MTLFLLFFYCLTFTVVMKLWIHQHWAIRTYPRSWAPRGVKTINQHTSALFLVSVSTYSCVILETYGSGTLVVSLWGGTHFFLHAPAQRTWIPEMLWRQRDRCLRNSAQKSCSTWLVTSSRIFVSPRGTQPSALNLSRQGQTHTRDSTDLSVRV